MTKQENYIMYGGEKFLISDYTTMAMKAASLKKSEGYIRKIVFRNKHQIKQPKAPVIEYIDIQELKLILVKK